MKNIYPIAIAVTMASTPVWAQTAAQQPQAAPAPTATEAPATRAATPSDATAPSAITPPKSTTMELDRSKPMLTDEEAKAWVDKVVYSSDDKNLGEVADFKRDAAGHVTELHADIGGFLGLGETREEFGGSERFVRVVAGQAVHLHRAGRLLSHPALAKRVDAYAIAPYFGHDLHVSAQSAPNPDALMARLAEDLEKTRRVIRANVELARKAGVALIAYEGGQHVTNPPHRDDFCAGVNRHPQMESLYARYMDIWEEETQGALMVLFADMSTYGRFGCWGLSEFHGQSLQAAPKLRAVRERTLRLEPRPGASGSRP